MRGLRLKYLLPNFCISDSTYLIIMQHDHVLKRLNFDLLIPSPGLGGGGGGGVLRAKYLLPCYHVAACVISFNLICNMTIF